MKIHCLTLALLALATVSNAQQDVDLDFGSRAHDIEIDAARARAYVSLPGQGRVSIVDTNTWVEVGEYLVGGSPTGLDLSLDGTRLFVAKSGAGSVVIVDLVSGSQSELFLSAELGNALTYDVKEARPDDLFVSASPGSGGFAWIVRVDLANGNTATRVASNRIIRCNPTFAVHPGRTALYIGECFSPASLYELDLTQPSAPIVAEDDHGSVAGTTHLTLDPTGDRIFLRGGQIVDSSTLQVVGVIGGGGIPRFDVDPNRVFITASPGEIQTWNVQTFAQLDSTPLPCSIGTFNSPTQFTVLPGETGFVILTENRLCGVAAIPPCVTAVETVCAPLPNATGVGADLVPLGEPLIAQNAFSFELRNAPAGQYALLVYGQAGPPIPLGNGTLCVSPFDVIRRYGAPGQTDPAGTYRVPLDFTTPPLVNGQVIAYSAWTFQAWFRDPSGAGVNTSAALQVTFCP